MSTIRYCNSDRYLVERSADGHVWIEIGVVPSMNDESELIKTYRFKDLNPNSGENLYRLKMVDKDETFAFSSVRSIAFDKSGIFIYPNPTSEVLYIKDSNSKRISKVSIYDTRGQMVHAVDSISSSGIMVKHLPIGIYMVRIDSEGEVPLVCKVLINR